LYQAIQYQKRKDEYVKEKGETATTGTCTTPVKPNPLFNGAENITSSASTDSLGYVKPLNVGGKIESTALGEKQSASVSVSKSHPSTATSSSSYGSNFSSGTSKSVNVTSAVDASSKPANSGPWPKASPAKPAVPFQPSTGYAAIGIKNTKEKSKATSEETTKANFTSTNPFFTGTKSDLGNPTFTNYYAALNSEKLPTSTSSQDNEDKSNKLPSITSMGSSIGYGSIGSRPDTDMVEDDDKKRV
jgi:hypothetical protein